MTRLEDLTLRLADDVLTDVENRELQALLAESESASKAHIRVLRVEAALRGERRDLMLAPAIMSGLRKAATDSLVSGVMQEIRNQPVRRLERLHASPMDGASITPARWLARWMKGLSTNAWLSSAAALALAAGLGVWLLPPAGSPALAEIDGAVPIIVRDGRTFPAVVGERLLAGDSLRTPEDGTAVVSFAPEQTRLTLQPKTELKLMTLSRKKRLALFAGELESAVAHQRGLASMMIATPQTEATVVGTEFSLAALPNATRLDVFEGVVRLKRLSDGAAVQVAGGSVAVAASDSSLQTRPITGKILREIWLDLPGDSLMDLRYSSRYPHTPTRLDFPTNFETQVHWPSAFGTRARGYLLPPISGDYEFGVAGQGQVSLWLSPDDDPAGKVKIAQIMFTRNQPGDPDTKTSHALDHSEGVALQAGRRYYIEVLHKYGSGEDRLSVTWKRPDAAEEPIPAEFLAPFPLGKDARR